MEAAKGAAFGIGELMADIREIRNHIKSVEDTEKITDAMYMIATSKMRRAKKELAATKPYFDTVSSQIKRVFRLEEAIDSKYYYPTTGEHDLPGDYAYLVITSDKGLAGYYNHAVIKETEKQIAKHPSRIYMVGEYGRHYMKLHDIPIVEEFRKSAESPTLRRARNIAHTILQAYKAGEVSKVFVIYTDLSNAVSQQVKCFRLLPFHQGDFKTDTVEKEISSPFEFYPSLESVLENVVSSYMSGYIYSALVDSFCCEQSARMNAMEEANRNADTLLSELRLSYNHARQSKITQEITEISAGSRAIRLKKQKKMRKEYMES